MDYIHQESVHNFKAASQILPLLKKIIPFNSILDVGCGIGTWLAVAKKMGIKKVLGIDGDYVDRKSLFLNIQAEEYLVSDLRKSFDLKMDFDLILCLEVAEHLPEFSSDILIDSLTRHSELILFSAAIPGQGGQNHLNEQPPGYWVEKFKNQGYHVYDPIRPLVWDSPEVDVWYKQNILLFSRTELEFPSLLYSHIVHPELFEQYQKKNIQYQNELKKLKSGNARPLFYLKRFFQSLFRSTN